MAPKFTTGLQAYTSNAFYGLVVQDDDKIADEVYAQNWSKDVQENDNGNPLNYTQFHALVTQTRASITNRYLESQSFLIVPSDLEGDAGVVAHTSNLTGTANGKDVKISIVSVLKVVVEGGVRKVRTESFVLKIS